MADASDTSAGNEGKIIFKPKKRKPIRAREVHSDDDSDTKEEEVDL